MKTPMADKESLRWEAERVQLDTRLRKFQGRSTGAICALLLDALLVLMALLAVRIITGLWR